MWKLLFVVFLLSVTAFGAEVEEDDNVLILTEENFDEVIKENEDILVEFYAPWCGHCKSLAPQYAKAATQLKNENSTVKLGKVDCTVHDNLAATYKIRGYPTLKFFRNGSPLDYDGGRDHASIVAWLKKKTGTAFKKLKTVEDFEKFKESADVVVVGYFKKADSAEAKIFDTAAHSTDKVQFGLITDKKVAKAADLTSDGIALFKKFDDEGRVDFDDEEVTTEKLQSWIQANRLALITEFSHARSSLVFGGDIKLFAFLFASKKADDFDDLLKEFKTAAKKFKGQLIFVLVDTNTDENSRVMEYFGISESDIPGFRLISMKDDMEKFKPDFEEITAKNIAKYIKTYLAGDLKPHLKSDDIPEDWDKNPVKTLVGKNFEAVARNPEKHVFVEFYAPWCGHCQALAPIWDELGEKYKDHESIVIAKMDGTTNEVEKLGLKGYPTMVLFKAGDNKEVDFDGDRTLEALVEFLETNTKDKDREEL